MKCKDVDYELLKDFFQKQSAVENSFSAYVCYAPDGSFWLNLYVDPSEHNNLMHRIIDKSNFVTLYTPMPFFVDAKKLPLEKYVYSCTFNVLFDKISQVE